MLEKVENKTDPTKILTPDFQKSKEPELVITNCAKQQHKHTQMQNQIQTQTQICMYHACIHDTYMLYIMLMIMDPHGNSHKTKL